MHAQVGNWDDLRFFLAVARHGRLSAAADQLGVNHSTVFRRIAALEERIGSRLFNRHSSGHELTGAGEEMLAVAERIEEEVLSLDRQVLGRDQALRGLIRVTSADFGTAITPYFQSFLEAHPGVDLEVLIDNRFLSLHRREADVAVRPGGKPSEPDLVARKVATMRFAVYAATSYLSRTSRPASVADLTDHSLVAGDHHLAHMPSNLWLHDKAAGARIRYRANTVLNQAAAVSAGVGIGVLPCLVGDADPSLQRLFVPDDLPTHDVWLVYHGDLKQTARVRSFITHIADAMDADTARFLGE